ncbi:MAG: hypothetical protein M1830_004044, partial [Pleopsidium flavum]
GFSKTFRHPFEKQSGICRIDRSSVASSSAPRGPSTHSTRSSTMSTARTSLANTDVLGVFATKAIRSSDVIMLDATATGVCKMKEPAHLWELLQYLVCTADCTARSWPPLQCQLLQLTTTLPGLSTGYYHKVVCDKDFEWLYEESKDADTDG